MDVELKFNIGEAPYSIDVHKKHLEQLKNIYKALIRIAEIQHEGEIAMEYARMSLNTAAATLGRSSSSAPVVDSFNALTQASYGWLSGAHQKYVVKDFGSVFERYIHT